MVVRVERRKKGMGGRRGGKTKKGWSTWLGGVFLVPGFRLLGREARGSFCSPRRRIRRPTLSPPTRSSSPPSPLLLRHSLRPSRHHLPYTQRRLLPLFGTSILPQPPLRLAFLPQRSPPLLLPLRQPELWLITYRRSP